jgi:putative nucleotidyltransferase with HDIG domain
LVSALRAFLPSLAPAARFTPAIPDVDPEAGFQQTVERALDAAREMLEMDVAYLAELRGEVLYCRHTTGAAESFGLRPGDPVGDAAGLGGSVGVPVRTSDGTLFGTLGCLSHSAPALQQRDVRFMEVLATLIADQLEREARNRHAWRMAAAAGSAQALLAGLAARDGYTEEHSKAVVDFALAIGRRLGLADLRNLEWAALLHDIGKIGVSDAILRKPGKLTEEEWVEMRRHAEIGERIIAATPELAHLARTVRAEHERWDGTGYPDGLMGHEIPLASRIVFVSDAYHAMTSDRPYRAALPAAEARAELERNAGTQFDPTVVAAALAVLDE